jgi:hypothetical protein
MFSDTKGKNMSKTNATRSKFNTPLEPKLSRPTTTIINLGTQYSSANAMKKMTIQDEDEKNISDEQDDNVNKVDNPLGDAIRSVDENDQDEYMNKIHKFIREAFENRDHKMDFVY